MFKVLTALGVDIKGSSAPLDRVIIPILLAKMPSELASVVPIKSVITLAEFLQRYDGQPQGLSHFQSLAIKREDRPSVACARMCDQLSDTWGMSFPETQRNGMAWDFVKMSLPVTIRFDYSTK